jgi:hypothetical protein
LPDPLPRGEPAHRLEENMALPKSFQNFAEFEREVLRGSTRVGLSLEDMVEDDAFEAEIEVDSDDPFASMRDDY